MTEIILAKHNALKDRPMKEDTKIVRAGRHPERFEGAVNPPVFHASTILRPTLDAMDAAMGAKGKVTLYGRRGTPTQFAFEEAVTEIEGGFTGFSYPSGLAAIAAAMIAFAEQGAHFLVTDSAYAPARRLCETLLKRFGVTTTYYDPLTGAGIEALIRPNTKIVFTESPGSLTFEVQDIPAIAAAAHARGVKVLMDNTWASPLFFKPFEHGVDVSIQAATKYIVGHSDAMLGTVTTTEACADAVQMATQVLGYHTAPDDAYLGQRGIRTLGVRMRQHHINGIALATWLKNRPEVKKVMHPALPDDPGHALWKRDFTGASGLFGTVFEAGTRKQLAAFVDGLVLFGMGASWGGYESLCLPTHPEKVRSVTPWDHAGPTIRFHAGLEDIGDLIADLDAAFARWNAAK